MRAAMSVEEFSGYKALMRDWFNGRVSKFAFEFKLHNLLGYRLLQYHNMYFKFLVHNMNLMMKKKR